MEEDAFAPHCPFCNTHLPADDPTGDRHTCPSGPTLDLDEARRWLDLVYPPGGRDELLHIGHPAGDGWSGSGFADRDQLLQHVAGVASQQPLGIYHSVCSLQPAAGRRRRREDARWLFGMWSDLDIAGPGHKHDPAKYDGRTLPPDEDTARAVVAKAGLPEPSAWIHSGGGLYAWWLLDQPAPAQEHADLAREWQAALARGAHKLGHHYGTGVGDLARVLRLPGTLNWKVRDQPRRCRILSTDGPRYTIESLRAFADAVKPAEEPRSARPGPPGDPFSAPRYHQDDDTPLNAFEKATDWSDILMPNRWTLHHTDSDGTRYWERPGGSSTGGHSATTGHAGDRDRLFVFSDEAGFEVNTPLTKGFVYAHYWHGGNLNAAARHLYEKGYGARHTSTSSTGSKATPDPEPDVDADDEEAFWRARPAHQIIRQFAQARLVSPWATMAVVLARVAAVAPPWWVLPPLTGAEGSLNLFVGLVGRASDGKGGACAVGTAAVDLGLHNVDWLPLGTGQGVAHAYMKWEEVEKGEPKPTSPTMYCHTRIFRVDEIDQLTAHAKQNAATIMPTLRQAWMGEQLGHFYADASRRMIVPAHAYRFCLVAGIQPERAGPLLEDVDGGTPQRFLWMPAVDSDMPEQEPSEPHPLLWQAPVMSGPKRILDVCGTARRTIKEARRARMRGDGDALDGHLLFSRLKVAAALALLDGRVEVAEQDWQLAGVVIARSQATRSAVASALEEVAARVNRGKALADAERAAVVADSEDERRIRRVAQTIKRRLAGAHPERVTVGKLRNKLTSHDRDYFGAAVDRLIATGDVDEQGEGRSTSYGIVTGRRK